MSLKLIVGPMFSGKTTTLIETIENEYVDSSSVLIIVSKKNTRYGGQLVTHDGATTDIENVVVADKLDEIDRELLSKHQVFAIDEGHFFDDLFDFLQKWTIRSTKNVIVAMINGYHDLKAPKQLGEIIGLVDDLIYLKTKRCYYCSQKPACFSHRYEWSEPDDWVGGSEKYRALCRDCYRKKCTNHANRRRCRPYYRSKIE